MGHLKFQITSRTQKHETDETLFTMLLLQQRFPKLLISFLMSDLWRDNLVGEKKEFDRLQAMDAALDEDQIAADIDKILSQKRGKSIGDNRKSDVNTAIMEEDGALGQPYEENFNDFDNRDKIVSQSHQPLASPELERAPETADRYVF